jgi:prophage DNA circulation protein
MHWLSHYLYDDMSRAAEIRRLNPLIQNLSLLEKGMEVSVYAR